MTDNRNRKEEPGLKSKDSRFLVYALCSVLFALFVIGCASPSKQLPPPPPKYIYQMEEQPISRSTNSLWNDSVNIFEDRKARRLNDLVTIKIEESLEGSGTADTDTSRDSSIDAGLTELLGMNQNFNIDNWPVIKQMWLKGNTFVPAVEGSAKSTFKGSGDTSREGELKATLTAKVVEVMPNGNLVLEARKELTINEERQILVLAGMVRPDDIESDNTVSSTKIADAHVYYVGDGVINDKQKPGWLVRIVDNAWPF